MKEEVDALLPPEHDADATSDAGTTTSSPPWLLPRPTQQASSSGVMEEEVDALLPPEHDDAAATSLESLSPDLPCLCPEKWGTLNQAASCSVRPDELTDAAKNWSVSQLLDKSRYDNKLPVLPSLQAAVEAEDSACAAANTPPQKRKYKALSDITPPEQLAIVTTSSPLGFISPESADGGEQSASHLLAGVLTKMQKTENELDDAKRQLLKLKAAEDKVLQLGKELEVERADRAAEVKAIRADCVLRVINADQERYTAGLRNMRDLVLTLFPDVIGVSELTLDALSASFVPPGFPPHQAPADQ